MPRKRAVYPVDDECRGEAEKHRRPPAGRGIEQGRKGECGSGSGEDVDGESTEFGERRQGNAPGSAATINRPRGLVRQTYVLHGGHRSTCSACSGSYTCCCRRRPTWKMSAQTA